MKLDKTGVEQLKERIKEMEIKLNDSIAKKGAATEGESNTWHDNFDFENATLEVLSAQAELRRLRERLSKIELVDRHNENDKTDIGDRITLYDYNFDDEFVVELNAHYNVEESEDEDIEITSINSPMGEAIYRKKIGEDISYKVDSREFKMKIAKIQKPLMQLDNMPVK